MKSYIYLSFLIIMSFLLGCAKEADRNSLEAQLEFVQTYPVVGDPVDFDVSDDYVFIAEDEMGFSIINRQSSELYYRTNKFGISSLTSIPLVRYNKDNNILFVVDLSEGHRLLPVKLDSLQNFNEDDTHTNVGSLYNARDLVFEDIPADSTKFLIYSTNFKYLLNTNQLMIGVFSTTATSAVAQLNLTPYPVPNAIHRIQLTPNNLIIAMGQRGLRIYNKNDLIDFVDINTPGEARDMKICDNYIYVADRQQGLQIIDITDISNPILLEASARATNGFATSIDISGQFLALGSGSGGVYLYDISNPTTPILIDNLNEDEIGYVYKVLFFKNELYISSKSRGIVRYQVQ